MATLSGCASPWVRMRSAMVLMAMVPPDVRGAPTTWALRPRLAALRLLSSLRSTIGARSARRRPAAPATLSAWTDPDPLFGGVRRYRVATRAPPPKEAEAMPNPVLNDKVFKESAVAEANPGWAAPGA